MSDNEEFYGIKMMREAIDAKDKLDAQRAEQAKIDYEKRKKEKEQEEYNQKIEENIERVRAGEKPEKNVYNEPSEEWNRFKKDQEEERRQKNLEKSGALKEKLLGKDMNIDKTIEEKLVTHETEEINKKIFISKKQRA